MALSRTDVGTWHNTSGPYGTGTWATSSFTPPANSILIIAIWRMGNAIGGPLGALSSISGGSLSYTLIGAYDNSYSWAIRLDIYRAEVGGSPSSMAITVDDANNIYAWGCGVTAYTGYDSGTPITGYVDTADDVSLGNGAESQTLAAAPTANDVSLSYIVFDADSFGNPTYAAGWNDVYEDGLPAYGTTSCVERTSSTSTTVSVTDSYTGAGAFFKAGMISFNVKAAAATGFSVNVSDSVGHTESVSLLIGTSQVSKSESSSVSDTPTARPLINASKSESVAVSDTPTTRPLINLTVSDNITVADTPTLAVGTSQVSKSESVAVSDTPTARPLINITAGVTVDEEKVAISESVSVSVSAVATLSVSVSDNIAITESTSDRVKAAWYHPDSITAVIGSVVSGTIESTWADDGTRLQLSETIGTSGFTYDFYFYDVPLTTYSVNFNGYYQGNPAHKVRIQQWDFSVPQWVYLTDNDSDFPSDTTDQDYEFPILYSPNYISSGELRLRIDHSSTGNITHNLYIDHFKLSGIGAVNVHDHIAVADTPACEVGIQIVVSEAVVAAESVGVSVSAAGVLSVSVSDSIAVADTPVCEVGISVSVSDSIAVADTPVCGVGNPQVVVSEAVTAAESVGVSVLSAGTLGISVSDNVTAAESTTVEVSTPQINVSEAVTTSESVALAVVTPGTDLDVSVSESISLIESQYVSVSDPSISVTETVTLYIEIYYPPHRPPPPGWKNPDVRIAFTIEMLLGTWPGPQWVFAHDIPAVSVAVPAAPSVYVADSVAVSSTALEVDYLWIEIIDTVSCSDPIAITESVALSVSTTSTNVNVSDAPGTTDTTSVALDPLQVQPNPWEEVGEFQRPHVYVNESVELVVQKVTGTDVYLNIYEPVIWVTDTASVALDPLHVEPNPWESTGPGEGADRPHVMISESVRVRLFGFTPRRWLYEVEAEDRTHEIPDRYGYIVPEEDRSKET